jgi:cytidine deaminase
MTKKKLEFEYLEVTQLDNLSDKDIELIEKAKEASKNAYAPYSKFHVGAALLLDNGEIILGSNQENAAYPSGICAERTALYYAGSRYPDAAVKCIAITAGNEEGFVRLPISPCGSCRQVIIEAQQRHDSKIKIIMYGNEMTRIVENAYDLLPFPFDKIT